MRRQKKHNFLQSALILTVAAAVVKVIGMLYKIPLANILGAGGMSYFTSAYSIFNPVFALSVSGFPVAVSKMVSESMSRGRFREMRRIRSVSLALFLLTGVAGTLVMLLGAPRFARLIGNPGAAPAIAAIAPAIFFCCVISSFRGYYQGMSDMMPTASSQVIESVAKLVCGIAFSIFLLNRGLAQYAATGLVYGTPAESPGQAHLLALPFAAAGAVLGVTASTAVSAAYLLLRHAVGGDGLTAAQLEAPGEARGRRDIAKSLVHIALPVCLAAAVSHVSTLIDVATIMNRVGEAMRRDAPLVLAQYAGLFPADLPQTDIPSYLYGAYGFTSSLFNLVPSLTVTLGISVLPVVASDWALARRAQAAERIRSMLKLSALVSIPAGLGLSALSRPILELLYPARLSEVAVAAPILQLLGVAAVLTGITTPMMSVFQAVGKAGTPVRLMLCGAVLKALTNYVLLAVPGLNIRAAPVGTILCYAFILAAGLALLRRELVVRIEPYKTFIKPLICGIICAVAANTFHSLLVRLWDSRLAALAAIAVGGVFYAIFILFLRVITKNEALMLPNGKKVVKILEKLSFLG